MPSEAVRPPELHASSPAALDAWLAAREDAVPGVIPGDQKRIAWAGAPGAETEFSYERMGGRPKRLVPVQGAHSHMLAGDIFSPETTDGVSGDIQSFLAECGILRP